VCVTTNKQTLLQPTKTYFVSIRSAGVRDRKGIPMKKSVRITSGSFGNEDNEDADDVVVNGDKQNNSEMTSSVSAKSTEKNMKEEGGGNITSLSSPPRPLLESTSTNNDIWSWINSLRQQTGLPLLDKEKQAVSQRLSHTREKLPQQHPDHKNSGNDNDDDDDDDDYESDDSRKKGQNAQTVSHLLFQRHNRKTKKINKMHEIEMANRRRGKEFGFGDDDDDDEDDGKGAGNKKKKREGRPSGVDGYAEYSVLCLSKKNYLRQVML
jgi:hypothetical protein